MKFDEHERVTLELEKVIRDTQAEANGLDKTMPDDCVHLFNILDKAL
ncbi:MAG: hypothetical protein ACTID3_02415 [Halomonas sp.]